MQPSRATFLLARSLSRSLSLSLLFARRFRSFFPCARFSSRLRGSSVASTSLCSMLLCLSFELFVALTVLPPLLFCSILHSSRFIPSWFLTSSFSALWFLFTLCPFFSLNYFFLPLHYTPKTFSSSHPILIYLWEFPSLFLPFLNIPIFNLFTQQGKVVFNNRSLTVSCVLLHRYCFPSFCCNCHITR